MGPAKVVWLYPTRRAILLLLAGAPAALLLGLVRPELWLVAPGWIGFLLACLAIDAITGASPRGLRIDTHFPPQIGVGDPFQIQIAAYGARALPPRAAFALAVDGRIDPTGRIDGFAQRNDETATLTHAFPVAAARRGRAVIGAVWIRWAGSLGLVWKQRRFPIDGAIDIVPSLRNVAEDGSRLFQRGALFGLRQLQQGGEGSEFESLAEFHPGMDRRTIDWNASARHVKLLAKEFRIERDNCVVIAIDAGRTMAEPVDGMPRVDRAVSAGLLLAYASLKLNDRVSLFHFAARPQAMTPAYMHVRDLRAIQRAAAAIDYAHEESNFTLALATLGAALNRRSLIILFTEFTDPTSADLMIRAAARLVKKHRLLFVVLQDTELESAERRRPESPVDIIRSNVAAALLRDRALVIARLQRLGVDVLDVPHGNLGVSVVDAYLGMKKRGAL